MKTKAITIIQPWASLIIEGIKDIENRTWKTNYRGRVQVHAGAKKYSHRTHLSPLNMDQVGSMTRDQLHEFVMTDDFPLGAIIGSVEIVDCVINHPSVWAMKATPCEWCAYGLGKCECGKPIYNWVLANPIKFDNPIPCKGKLSFWMPDEEILRQLPKII